MSLISISKKIGKISINSEEKELYSESLLGFKSINNFDFFIKNYKKENFKDLFKRIKFIKNKISPNENDIMYFLTNYKNIDSWQKTKIVDRYKIMFQGEIAISLYNDYMLSIDNKKSSFIIRYGECEGEKRYNEFVFKSTQTKESFIEKYGNEIGIKKWNKFLETNACYSGDRPNNKKYWIKRGFTEDEAILKVSISQNKTSLEYYKSKYGEDGEQKYLDACIIKKYSSSKEQKLDKYGPVIGLLKWEKANKMKSINSVANTSHAKEWLSKIRTSLEKSGYWRTPEELDGYELYRLKVRNETKRSIKKHGLKNMDLVAPLYLDKDGHHVDHMYSCKNGHKNGILPHIIGGIKNLEVIPGRENIIKQDKNSIDLKDI